VVDETDGNGYATRSRFLRGEVGREPLTAAGRNVQIGTQLQVITWEGRFLPSLFVVEGILISR
jgi:hypothetical protein